MVIWHNALRALRQIEVNLDGIGIPIEDMRWRSIARHVARLVAYTGFE